MSKCQNCKKYEDCATGSGLTWPCGAYVPVIVTRADSIRAMSDEELAGKLALLMMKMQSLLLTGKILPPAERLAGLFLETLQKPEAEQEKEVDQ